VSAADEVARLEAETATAVSAAAVAQVAAAEAVRDAENLKHEVTRDAAETIRERDAEIATLKGDVTWLKDQLTATQSTVESTELAVMGLVMLANPPVTEMVSEPLTPQAEPNVDVVDPQAAKTKELPPQTTESNPAENPPESKGKQKRHRLL
jgi:hypothetical protein